MSYEPKYRSLSKHKIPKWYDEAKLGIFIHWGPYSVPAWAEPGDINERIKEKGHGPHFANNPYAEWYHNTFQIPGSPAQKYHHEKYGTDFPYKNFGPMLESLSQNTQMFSWASLFKKAGAKYVVMVTKHHDGFCMWPSKVKNPVSPGYHAKRDYLGELSISCKAEGMKMGIYYSGVIDWSVRNIPAVNTYTLSKCFQHNKKYIQYAVGQMQEIIRKYKPSILWNDIGFPWGYNLNKLFSFYYNNVPDGVINDRWQQDFVPRSPFLQPIVKKVCANIDKNTKAIDFGKREDRKFWFDYDTMEYASRDGISPYKWELIRGIGHSFGYNQLETKEDFLSGVDLVWMLVDTISKNGNLLINVGPKADGTIPDEQQEALEYLGEWMSKAGKGIYGTQPSQAMECVLKSYSYIRFVEKGRELFAFVKGKKGQEVRAIGICPDYNNIETITDLSKASVIVDDGDVWVRFEEDYVVGIKVTKKRLTSNTL